MLAPKLKQQVRFGPYEADFTQGILRKSGIRLRVQGKPLTVLQILVETPGEIVSRETLRARLWTESNVFVDFDKGLSSAVNKLREALCDSAETPRYIETVPRRGYRFLMPVQPVIPAETAPLTIDSPELQKKSETPRRSRRLALVLALLTCLAAAASAWVGLRTRGSARKDPTPTIAVLPFTNRSPDAQDEYLSHGLSDEVITSLGRVPGLRVIGWYSSSQFKRGSDPREIGQKLGVSYLVEGSYFKVGNRVRIDAELVKASDGFQLWAESFEAGIDDIVRIDNDISKAVAAALSANLLVNVDTDIPRSALTVNPEAYQAFLQARYFRDRWIVNELRTALLFLNRSLQIDPNYAPALALRASVINTMGEAGLIERVEAQRRAHADADQAIRIEPGSSDGYVALATVQLDDWDWAGADASLKRASEIAPRDPNVLIARSQLLRALGRISDCAAAVREVTVLDPLSPAAVGMLGNRLYYAGRYEEALSAQKRALELNPVAEFIHFNRSEAYLGLGRKEEALAEIKQEPGEFWSLFGKALVYYDLGRKQDSDAVLAELIHKHQYDQPTAVADVYAYRGEFDAAFIWLDRAYAQHDSGFIDLKVDPLINNLRSDPRYSQLLKKLGLPD